MQRFEYTKFHNVVVNMSTEIYEIGVRICTCSGDDLNHYIRRMRIDDYVCINSYSGDRIKAIDSFLKTNVNDRSEYGRVVVYGDDEGGYILFEKSHKIVLPNEDAVDQISTLPKDVQKEIQSRISSINPMQIEPDDIMTIIKVINDYSNIPQDVSLAKNIYGEIIDTFKDEIISNWEQKYKVYFKDIIESDFPAGVVSNSSLPNDRRRIVLKGETQERYLRSYLQMMYESFFNSYFDNASKELDFDSLDDIGQIGVLDNTVELIQLWLEENRQLCSKKIENEFKKIILNCKLKQYELLNILKKIETKILFDAKHKKTFYAFLYRFIIFYFQHKMIRDGIKIHNHFIDDKNTHTAAFLEDLVQTKQGKNIVDFCLQIDKQKVKMYTLKYFAKYYQFDKYESNKQQRESDLRELWDLLLKTKNDRNGLREKDERIPDELPAPCINLSFMSRGENGQYFDQKFLQFLAR